MSYPGFTNPDVIPYPGHAYVGTHPDHLATMAFLHGLDPAPPEHCRVLELGCGDGSNLIPMAYLFPQSEFVGIDLGTRPIAEGQAFALQLGLKNISLLNMDLMDFPLRFGHFDYIVAHGVYSWVPPVVRDKLLQVSGSVLSSKGVVYVSYNTYPGFHVRQMLREMLLFHVHSALDAETKINQALALSSLLADAFIKTDESDLYLKKEWEAVCKRSPGSLYHDELAEVNEALYFHEFVEHAARHRLQYLSEAEFYMMHDAGLPSHVREALRGLDDNPLLKEQYLDFIRFRRFRQTLLCHEGITLERHPGIERIRQLRAASPANPQSAVVDPNSDSEETFRSTNNATMICSHPVAKAAMLVLTKAWPCSLAFDELLAGIRTQLAGFSLEEHATLVGDILLAAYKLGVVDMHFIEPQFSVAAGERPLASRLARLQAERGELVTNLQHLMVLISREEERHLLKMMDGTRDRAELACELRKFKCDEANLEKSLEELGRLALFHRHPGQRIPSRQDDRDHAFEQSMNAIDSSPSRFS